MTDIVEMTPAESAWHLWAGSQDVDTGGRCTCGHEGLGVDWHVDDCAGANYALGRKVRGLLAGIAELRSWHSYQSSGQVHAHCDRLLEENR